MEARPTFNQLSDAELITEVKRLAAAERRATAALVASLVELDTRRLYLGAGCSSLFTYCTQVLHLAEGAAYNRIEAARAARRFPVILELLETGDVTLTTVRLLAPHLTQDNHGEVLSSARHKTKREIELLVASLSPRPPVPTVLRRESAPRTSPPVALVERDTPKESAQSDSACTRVEAPNPVATPKPRPALTPLAPERFRLQLTIPRDTHDKLRRVQDLLRHVVPNGDPATILDRALTLLLEELERRRLAAASSPRESRVAGAGSRHIPAAVRRAVWRRDDGRCAFVGSEGRCAERGFLEFHHVEPFAMGGPATVDNIELRCRAHNAYEASLFFGAESAGFVREGRAVDSAT
jgi:hypothetical protein